MNDDRPKSGWRPRGSSGRGERHGRDDSSSNWRRTARSRQINWESGSSSSTGNWNGGAAARSNTESVSSWRDPAKRETSWKNANHKNDNSRTFRYGYQALTNLLRGPPEEIKNSFLENKAALTETMASRLEPDVIVLLAQAFATVCSSELASNTDDVLVLALDDNYLRQLLQYVAQLPLHDEQDKKRNKVFWEKVEEFWSQLWFLLSQLLERVPTIAVDVLPKLVSTAVYTLQNFEVQQNVSISNETLAKFKELHLQLVDARAVKGSGGTKRRGGAYDEENPPDDFRKLSIYPTVEELTTDVRPFVRSNIVKGKYRNVEHYLDVHFRLLREDFVAPLRRSINDYLYCQNKKKQFSNIKIYNNVSLSDPRIQLVRNQIGFTVEVMENGRIKNVEQKKFFMIGSLVCFTSNNFETLFFGKIIKRNTRWEETRWEEIVVKFDMDVSINPKVKYTMVQYTVDFEPYYHALSALQKIDQDHFLLKHYLIGLDFPSELPNYVQPNSVFNIHSYNVNVMHRESWPHHDYMQLNESQFEAFYYAMNNRICVIQGNPGTGKSYLALQIAKMLLENHTKWDFLGPILLICNSNYALDQCLKGLLDTTQRIVRVGGQSTSDKLAEYNIKCEFDFNSLLDLYSTFDLYKFWEETRYKTKKLDQLNKHDAIFFFWTNLENDYNGRRRQFVHWLLEDDQKEWAKENQMPEPYLCYRESKLEIDSPSHIYDEIVPLITIDSPPEKQNSSFYMEYLKYRLHQLSKGEFDDWENVDDCDDDKKTSIDRWRLYALMVANHKKDLERDIQELSRDYKKHMEYKKKLETRLLSDKLIIGVTTKGVAKLQTPLQATFPIVIVEEAAELLESHVITTLTSDCKHLILIGDHKQLRPSTADYKMNVDHNLGVSLFERMIKNGFPCQTLNVQHRMRPEIAALVAPTIYPGLQNHQSVLNFEEIKGVDKSLYFITHQNLEQKSVDQSRENPHEATFLLLLAQYLVLNGYAADKITLLAAYSGQLSRLRKEQENYLHCLENVNIQLLDNYQGEENDIILLSLVRNNLERNIGFLNMENRVCVALSRARKGMYVMGNMDLLCEKSRIWQKINKVLERQNAIGESLLLRCQIHPDQETEVKCENDFKKVSDGGCSKRCGGLLECGHNCDRSCHILSHDQLPCKHPCSKIICDLNHVCPNKCGEKCLTVCEVLIQKVLSCGHKIPVLCTLRSIIYARCNVKVTKTRTFCPHTFEVGCSENVDRVVCRKECTKILPCGHKCKQNCNEKCGDCREMVEKIVEDCGHKVKCACSVKPTRKLCKCWSSLVCKDKWIKKQGVMHVPQEKCFKPITHVICPQGHNMIVPFILESDTPMSNDLLSYCKEKCTTQLECGHICSGTCDSCAQGRVHVLCKKMCNKFFVCGHECTAPCIDSCLPCSFQCAYRCKHGRCTSQCGMPCTPCLERCERRCPHIQCGKLCHEICEVEPCTEPCPKKLKCGHDCIGFCGDECPPLCRTCDADAVTKCFFGTVTDESAKFVYLPDCKHVLESSGLQQWIEKCLAEVSVIRCPKCEKYIRCLQRYDKFLKLSLKDVEAVKKKFGFWKHIIIKFKHEARKDMKEEAEKIILEQFAFIAEKFNNRSVSNQRVEDRKWELKRYIRVNQLAKIVDKSESYSVHPEYKKCRDLVFSFLRYNNEIDAELKGELSELSEKSKSGVTITDGNGNAAQKFSRKLNLGVGHWYKCPNGHINLISECGDGNRVSNCPECTA